MGVGVGVGVGVGAGVGVGVGVGVYRPVRLFVHSICVDWSFINKSIILYGFDCLWGGGGAPPMYLRRRLHHRHHETPSLARPRFQRWARASHSLQFRTEVLASSSATRSPPCVGMDDA